MNIRPLFMLASLLPILAFSLSTSAQAQQELPWKGNQPLSDQYRSGDGRTYREPGEAYDPQRHGPAQQPAYGQGGNGGGYDSGYDALRNNGRTQQRQQGQPSYGNGSNQANDYNRGNQAPRTYNDQRRAQQPYDQRQGTYRADSPSGADPRQGYRQGYQSRGPGQPYAPPSASGRYEQPYGQRRAAQPDHNNTYSDDEIMNAGHKFFGKITKGLAKVIAHVFKKSGRPNAYILGEEGGGALIAGLRYGEGTIYTKAGERQRIYWQGPSIGYDFGAEGAKTMILVYNLRDINKIYARFAGVDGSAYLVGGVGVTFQKRGRIVLAPIRSGLGVRLGANIGYLKYTRTPTWNPF